MGFRRPSLELARFEIGKSLMEISSPYNDGYIQRDCKEELYLLKCWLEDEYNKLSKFAGEDEWEQKRLIELLKK